MFPFSGCSKRRTQKERYTETCRRSEKDEDGCEELLPILECGNEQPVARVDSHA
jgi:hypothetical protein